MHSANHSEPATRQFHVGNEITTVEGIVATVDTPKGAVRLFFTTQHAAEWLKEA